MWWEGRALGAVPGRVRGGQPSLRDHHHRPAGEPGGGRLRPHRPPDFASESPRGQPGPLRPVRARLLVSGAFSPHGLALSRLLRVGRDLRGARACAGLDPGERRAHHAPGEAPLRARGQRGDLGVHLRGIPDPAARVTVQRRERAPRDGAPARLLHTPP